MAYRVEAKDVLIDASGNKTISLSDFGGETPKFVIAQSTKSTSNGNYQDGLFNSFGWGDLSQEDSAQISSADNVGTSEVARGMHDNILTAFDSDGQQALDGGTSVEVGNPAVVNLTGHGYATNDLVRIDGVAAVDAAVLATHSITKINDDSFSVPVNNPTFAGTGGFALRVTDRITLVSFSADEVVINVGKYGGTPFTVLFLILGGSTLTDVYVDSFNIPTVADQVTRIDIAFVDGGGGADTITTVAGDFSPFSSGQIIEVTGSASNDGLYTIDSVTSSVITLPTGVLTAEGAGPSINIVSGFILVQGAGFSPDAGMLFTAENDNAGGGSFPFIHINRNEAPFSFGFFERGGTQCAECRIYSEDQAATMETFSTLGTDAACWGHYSFKSGAWALRGSLTFHSMHATDGFILKQAISNVPVVSYRINCVLLKGGNYEVVQKIAPTSPGTQDIVNSGTFTPSGAMFLVGASGVANRAAMSIGWASNKDGTKANTKEGVAFISDDDAVDPSDTKRLTKTDKCFVYDAAGSTAVNNEADLHTWNADGVTLDFTTAASAKTYHCIQFGDGTVTPGAGAGVGSLVNRTPLSSLVNEGLAIG